LNASAIFVTENAATGVQTRLTWRYLQSHRRRHTILLPFNFFVDVNNGTVIGFEWVEVHGS
jgi:hypothetical protein